MTSTEIRKQFIDFFKARGHEFITSSPVVPHDDPTLMFANAGMNQFKPYFLGTETPNHRRVANTQKCIRAGGKHNDLDDVGQDTYHQTFFEMLGNWSFGDYFKEDAIRWAWELLTDVWPIEKDRLHATYFEGDSKEGLEPDTDARDIWLKYLPPDRVHPGSKKDNFWEMGDTGPCGPCSEIHVDLTPDKSGARLVNAGHPDVIELWNLVFIQFNRAPGGRLSPLPAKHVDTGMGFERLCAVLNGKKSNYDTDVFAPIFAAIQERCAAPDYAGTLPGDGRHEGTEARMHEDSDPSPERKRRVTDTDAPTASDPPSATPPPPSVPSCLRASVPSSPHASVPQQMTDVTYRVIADHLRCLVFAITDGALPSNEGRGYVLRRILRRAVRYGRQYFGMTEPFLCDLVPAVVNQLADTFPELRTGPNPKHPRDNATYVADILRDEEVAALEAIRRGEPLWWQAAVRSLKNAKNKSWVLSGPNPPAGEEADVGTVGEQDISRLGLREKLFLYRGSSPVASRVTISFDTFHVDDVRHALSSTPTISGQDAFNLHQTCGFLIDVTVQAAEERGIEVDIDEYERLMEDARERARGASLGKALISRVTGIPEVNLDIITDDSPKYQTKSLEARYLAGWSVGGGNIALAFDRTCFYAEQGGQVGDKGTLCKRNGEYLFGIIDTRQSADVVLHIPDPREFALLEPNGKQMSIDSMYKLKVDDSHRIPTMQNHTATHLLNWSLREVLGTHVQQKGSLVDPEKTRFDFSHNKPLTPDEISRIESHVNERIAAGLTVYAPSREEDFVDRKKALDINTLRAVFGEKYPEKVRVVSIGVPIDDLLADPENPKWMNYSVEFCGGTHVRNTSEIDRFVLTSEEAVAKGVRRLVGLTGSAAQTARRLGSELLAEAKSLAQAIPLPSPERKRRDAHDTPLPQLLADLQSRIESATIPLTTRHRIRALIEDVQRTIKEQSKQAATAAAGDVLTRARELLNDAETVGDTRVIVAEVPPANPDALRGAIDWFRQKTVSSAVLLVCTDGEKVTLLAGMSKDLVKRGLRSGDLIKEIAPLVGGRGGGRPDMAQGGGHNPQAIPEVIQRATEWLHERII